MQNKVQATQGVAESLPLKRKAEKQSLDPYPFYKFMRDQYPVFCNSRGPAGSAWEVYCYEDVVRILSDYTTFSSEQGITDRIQIDENPVNRSLVKVDPPRHKQLRPLVAQAFTPRMLGRLVPRIRELIQQHLDAVADAGFMEIGPNFSASFPVMVIAELLGIPPEQRRQFKQWADCIIGVSQERYVQALQEMHEYFRGVIAQRRVEEKNDLISDLLRAQVEGDHLSEQEVLTFCALLLVAGVETTTNLLNSTIICLDRFPEVVEALRADPSLIPGTIDEVLRYLSPLQWVIRSTTADTVIRDQKIKAGEIVLLCLGSANRDETQFADPERFDIRRNMYRHIAFGHGIHHCLGSALARLEAQEALPILLQRFKTFRRIKHEQLERFPSTFVYGVQHLFIEFTLA